MTLYFNLVSHRGSFYREGISLHMHIICLNCGQRGLFSTNAVPQSELGLIVI